MVELDEIAALVHQCSHPGQLLKGENTPELAAILLPVGERAFYRCKKMYSNLSRGPCWPYESRERVMY